MSWPWTDTLSKRSVPKAPANKFVFFATTGLTEFWDTSRQPIVLLGSWCLRCDRRSEWSNLQYEVLPSPWDDKRRFNDAILYLHDCYEQTLAHLSEYLNAVHGTIHTPRYWRIILGPWLILYTHGL